jgi:hypothetical protein
VIPYLTENHMKSLLTTLAVTAAMAPFVHGVTTFGFENPDLTVTSGTALRQRDHPERLL